jgi:hypothetical protein
MVKSELVHSKVSLFSNRDEYFAFTDPPSSNIAKSASNASNDLESDFFGPFVSNTVESNCLPSLEPNPIVASSVLPQQTEIAPTISTDFESLIISGGGHDVKPVQNKNFMNKDSILALYNNSSSQQVHQPQPAAQSRLFANRLLLLGKSSFFNSYPDIMFMPQVNNNAQFAPVNVQQQYGMVQQPQNIAYGQSNMQMQFNQPMQSVQMGAVNLNAGLGLQSNMQAKPQTWPSWSPSNQVNLMTTPNHTAPNPQATMTAAATANLFNFGTNGNTLSSNLWQ